MKNDGNNPQSRAPEAPENGLDPDPRKALDKLMGEARKLLVEMQRFLREQRRNDEQGDWQQ